jgi:hypothetical protein
MRSTRGRCTTALMAAAIGCGLVAAAPTGALAAPAGHAPSSHAKPAAVAHPDGFYVTGETPPAVAGDSPSALVRDKEGRQHIVTVKRSPSAPGQGHILYLTRSPSEKHWLVREIPGLRPLGGIQVEEHLGWDEVSVFIVLYQCNGVFVTDASLAATRMPEPTLVQAANNCSSPGKTPTASAPPIADAAGLPGAGDTVGIILPDPSQSNQPALFTGQPGGTFTAEPVYTEADGFVPVQMTVDAWTGRITVVGAGTNGTDKGIYEVSKLYYESTWGAITRIAGLASATSDYTIESVTAYKGATWVGLLKPHPVGRPLKNSLYLVQGLTNGQFFGALPLPHSTGQDTALVLTINQGTNHLHAAFTRVNPAAPAKKSGIMVEARFGGKWQTPKFLTHWDRDYTDALTLTAKGQAVIGYVQR